MTEIVVIERGSVTGAEYARVVDTDYGDVVELALTDFTGVEILSVCNGTLIRQHVEANKRFISLADLPDKRS